MPTTTPIQCFFTCSVKEMEMEHVLTIFVPKPPRNVLFLSHLVDQDNLHSRNWSDVGHVVSRNAGGARSTRKGNGISLSACVSSAHLLRSSTPRTLIILLKRLLHRLSG